MGDAAAGLDIALQEETTTAKGELVLPLRGFVPGSGTIVRMGEGSDNIGTRTQVGREIVRIDLLLDAAGTGRTTANELTIAIKLVATIGGCVDLSRKRVLIKRKCSPEIDVAIHFVFGSESGRAKWHRSHAALSPNPFGAGGKTGWDHRIRGQRSEVGGRKSGVGGRRVGGRKSGVELRIIRLKIKANTQHVFRVR